MNKHNEIKCGLIPHSYYNIPTKIYKSFYEQNTEKFLGIFPYGQNLVKMHRKDGQWRNTNRNYTENGFMMKKHLRREENCDRMIDAEKNKRT